MKIRNEIEEMQKIIKDRDILDPCGWGDTKINYESSEIAEAIYTAGYHKTVWHKVADGDLPEANKLVICFRNRGYGVRYAIGYVDRNSLWFLRDNMFFENIDAVLAWTELPEYKEQ